MNKKIAKAIFLLAGFEVLSVSQIPNDYWPIKADYEEVRKGSPWWIVKTIYGDIKIGYRKRVISIEFDAISKTIPPEAVTTDQVTNEPGFVHAWNSHKAVEYLCNIRAALRKTSGNSTPEEA